MNENGARDGFYGREMLLESEAVISYSAPLTMLCRNVGLGGWEQHMKEKLEAPLFSNADS